MRIFIYSLVLFSFGLIIVTGDEPSHSRSYPNLSEDYLSIFKNMPLLYEYILATLTKNPEVLEYSHQSYSESILDYTYSRSNNEPVNNDDDVDSDKENEVRVKRITKNDAMAVSATNGCTQDVYSNNGNKCTNDNAGNQPFSLESYLNNIFKRPNDELLSNDNVNLVKDDSENSNNNFDSNIDKRSNDESINNNNENINEEVSENNNEIRNDGDEKLSDDKVCNDDNGNNCNNDKSSVDPREVEHKAIWAEEILEEYNNSR